MTDQHVELIKNVVSQNWVGSAIGLLGVIIALITYRASRLRAKIAYQVAGLRLIGKAGSQLPEEVTISYKGSPVARLTKSHIRLWNVGGVTVRGTDIVEEDPIRIVFDEDTEVLSAEVIGTTRSVNKFALTTDSDKPGVLCCSFDFLDPGDGAVIETLHTSPYRFPIVLGTVRGMPKGLSDYGIDYFHMRAAGIKARFPIWAVLLMQLYLVGVTVWFIPTCIVSMVDKGLRFQNCFMLSIALLAGVTSAFSLHRWRRRYPKALRIIDRDVTPSACDFPMPVKSSRNDV